MRIALQRLCVLVLALLGLVGSSAAQGQLSFDDFVGKLSKAIEFKDEKELDKLVKSNSLSLVLQYEFLVRDFMNSKRETLKPSLEAITASWKRVFESGTLERVERYWSALSPERWKDVDKAVDSLNKLYANWSAVAKGGKREEMVQLADDARKIAKGFEDIGHPVRAAQAWLMVAGIMNALPGITMDERNDAIFAIEQFKNHRDRWEYTKDLDYQQNTAWIKSERSRIEQMKKDADKRKAEGYSGDVKGAEAFLTPNAKEEIAALEFKPLAKPGLDFFTRGGPTPGLWHRAQIYSPDGKYDKPFAGPTEVKQFHAKQIYVVRPAGNKYGVTMDGKEADAKKMTFEDIKVSTNAAKLEPTVFHLGAKGQGQPYAMFFYQGSNQELLMGMKQNLQPTPGNATLLFRSAASWTCTLAGEPVTFLDDNCNGKLFEEDPLAANIEDRTLSGPKVPVKVPSFDSVQIGKNPPVPFSSWLQIGANWYHVRAQDGGLKVGIRPANPEYFKTGTVTLKWNGPANAKPEVLVIRGKGELANANFDVASGKPVTVPIGKYELAWGRIVSGKGDAAISAQVFVGKHEAIEVEAGKACELKLGGPFRLDFDFKEKGGEIEINSLDFRIFGAAGEQYGRINGAPPIGEVLAGKAKDGKGAKPMGEFVPCEDPEVLNKIANANGDLGTEVGFFPVAKTGSAFSEKLKFKSPGAGTFYAVTTSKHKLFGKLEPVWKDK